MDDIFSKHPSQVAYLAGAGISVPPPSSLPSASTFISLLVETITDDPNLRYEILSRTFASSTEKRFQTDFLRFEAVIGAIKLSIDPQLQLLRIYSECITPNSYHFFLAEQLEQGAIILTTNFDNLIEIACRDRGIYYSLIVSDKELDAYIKAPSDFKNPIIKLHGGYDLIYSNSKRRGAENVKATLEQVGKVYLGGGSNQLTSVFATVSRDRHLIVIGYSGCDDFDIMPCIIKEDFQKGLTWIDHSEQPCNVLFQPSTELPDLPPYRLLAESDKGQSNVKIIRGNTIEALNIDMNNAATKEPYDWTHVFESWLQEHIVTEAQRQLLLGQLLSGIERYKESLLLLEGISTDTLTDRQIMIKNALLSNLYVILNENERAIQSLSKMISNEQEIEGISLKGYAYYNLARINTNMSQYPEAEMYLNAAIKIFRRLKDYARISDCLHELGRISIDTGDSKKGIEYIESSIQLCDSLGDMTGTAIGLTEIAIALSNQRQLDKAENYARKAIAVFGLNSNLTGLGIAHHALGYIFAMRKDYEVAACEFKQAIRYERSVGSKLDLSHSLHSLGDMLIGLKELDEAQECLEESIRIKREIKDTNGIANSELLLNGLLLLKTQG